MSTAWRQISRSISLHASADICYWSESLRSKVLVSQDEIDEFVVKGFTPWKPTAGTKKKEGGIGRWFLFPNIDFQSPWFWWAIFPPLQFINIPGTQPWERSHIPTKRESQKIIDSKVPFRDGNMWSFPDGVPLVSSEVAGLFLPSTHPWMASIPRSFRGPQPFVFPKSSNPLLNFQELPSWDLFDASHLPPSVHSIKISAPEKTLYFQKTSPNLWQPAYPCDFGGFWGSQKKTFLIWVFPKIGVPQNGWFIWKTLLKWMIWGYHHLRKHPFRIGRSLPWSLKNHPVDLLLPRS